MFRGLFSKIFFFFFFAFASLDVQTRLLDEGNRPAETVESAKEFLLYCGWLWPVSDTNVSECRAALKDVGSVHLTLATGAVSSLTNFKDFVHVVG